MAEQIKNEDQTIQQPKGLLTDDLGKRSMMRLMSFIALLTAVVTALITLFSCGEGMVGVWITASFLLAAFAPKAVQKFIENSYPLLKK